MRRRRPAQDKVPEEVRCGFVHLLAALAQAGGTLLWANGGAAFEEAVRACVAGLDEPAQVSRRCARGTQPQPQPQRPGSRAARASALQPPERRRPHTALAAGLPCPSAAPQALREAYAAALGELAASGRHELAAQVVSEEKKPAKKAALEKVLAGGFRACLVQPFVDAAVAGRREACAALAMAWVGHCASVPARYKVEPDWVVEVAVQAVGALEAAYKAHCDAAGSKAALAAAEAELGASIAGARAPLLPPPLLLPPPAPQPRRRPRRCPAAGSLPLGAAADPAPPALGPLQAARCRTRRRA
jgi:hypothetical protein